MAPPVQMVQSIRHDQLVSNMSANCTFQSEFLQSRRLLADEAAGCSKVKESLSSAVWRTTGYLLTAKVQQQANNFCFSC
ncbi:uncharacterized protein LOC144006931 isoform X3 [Festucalex cinctus]